MASSSLVINATAVELGIPHISYAGALAPHALLLYGLLDYTLTAEDSITCATQTALKPYSGMALDADGKKFLLLLLQFKRSTPKTFSAIHFRRGDSVIHWPVEAAPAQNADAWADSLPPAMRKRAQWFLLQLLAQEQWAHHPALAAHCDSLRRRIDGVEG